MKLSYAVKITAWLRFASRNNVPINPAILMQKANDFSQAAGHEDFNLLMDGFVGGRSIHIVIELHTMGAESDGLLLHITVSLTYRLHLESLRAKLTSRVILLRWLAGSDWGAGATNVQIAGLTLVHSTAECCAPVWCRSAHTGLIDPAINDALRIVIGCLRPTPADNLPILEGIQPGELHCKGATLSLACRASSQIKIPICARRTCQQLNSSSGSLRAGHWASHQWKAEWMDNLTRLRTFFPGIHPLVMILTRRVWVPLNRLHTTVGRFRSLLNK